MKKTLLISILLLSVSLYGQKTKAIDKNPGSSSSMAVQAEDYHGLQWRNIGPFRGGRSVAVSGIPNNDQVYLAGYTGGGLWKTEDAGISWLNISDGFFQTGSVGDIAVSESDPNVLYVGMGEHAIRGVMTTYGDGVYKSVDGGKTWTHLGLEKTRHISDVIIHPTNPEVVFVAAQGAAHGLTEERGIYKSEDGGKTWKRTLYVDENTGASSLSMDMNNPRILYAATWEHIRLPWQVRSGGSGCAIWKSTDSGETWTKINQGLPSEMGKIGVSVSRANSQKVYAIVEAEKSVAGLYRSDNGGATWTHMTNNPLLTSRSWYYMEVLADPINEDVVYVLNSPLTRSIDGGKTFNIIPVRHIDTHDLWINPNNPSNMILGDDGGAEITFNRGKSWSTQDNQPTGQFYRVITDQLFPYRIYGGQQDNTSVVIASRNNYIGITEKDWTYGPGCECAFIAFDPKNPLLLYGGCYQGGIEVLNTENGHGKDIRQYPSNILAFNPQDMKYRFNWNAPIIASPHDYNTIYHGAQLLMKTTDGGLTWQEISPDLTRNEKEKQGLGGAPITNEGAGGENYNTLSYVIESQHEKGVIYTGSDCGKVYMTRNGGDFWEDITPAGLSESLIYSIEISPHDPATAYISATRYKFNDFASMSYKTTDYGKSWRNINQGIQKDDFIRVIREDRKVKDLLYAGSERGFYLSYNGGKEWHRFQLNLPVVPITDMAIPEHENDLVVATAGRSFWILDDLSSIQQSVGKEISKTTLISPKPSIKYEGYIPSWMDLPPGIGENPRMGVILDYVLPEDADSTGIRLEILDAVGNVIRSYSSLPDTLFKAFSGGPPAPKVLPAKKGFNRFAWDFRRETLPPIPDAFVYGDYRGSRVSPGNYSARLISKNDTSQVSIELQQDPNLQEIGQAQWDEQQQFLQKIETSISDIHRSVNDLRKVKSQLAHYNGLLKDREGEKVLYEQGEKLVKMLSDWEDQVVQTRQSNFQDVINFPSRLNAQYFSLKEAVDTHDPRLARGAKVLLKDLDSEWLDFKKELSILIDEHINSYNTSYKERSIPALIIGK